MGERKDRWNRLMMYLAELQLTYSPNWGANGQGDEKLYEFVTGLIEELEGWQQPERDYKFGVCCNGDSEYCADCPLYPERGCGLLEENTETEETDEQA